MIANRIRWKRGIFRLWLVVSILWIIGSMSFVIPKLSQTRPVIPDLNIITETLDSLDNPNITQESTLPSKSDLLSIKQDEDCISIDPLQSVPCDSWKVTIHEKSKSPMIIDFVPDNTKAPILRKLVEQHLKPMIRDWYYSVTKSTLIVVLPPVILLIIGLLGSWIIAGFSTQ